MMQKMAPAAASASPACRHSSYSTGMASSHDDEPYEARQLILLSSECSLCWDANMKRREEFGGGQREGGRRRGGGAATIRAQVSVALRMTGSPPRNIEDFMAQIISLPFRRHLDALFARQIRHGDTCVLRIPCMYRVYWRGGEHGVLDGR